LVAAVLGHFTFGMLGVTIGYHRLLTHRGFACPKWFEHTLALLGICCLQDSPARWVAIHRMHHQFSDDQPDPHTPLVGFFWSHFGWVMVQNRDHDGVKHYERYVRDLLREPFYFRLERYGLWFWTFVAHAVLFYLGGALAGWLMSGTLAGAVQFGLSMLVWGVFVRTVFVLHGTWAVNSLGHMFGYQNYDTHDHSRNNFFVALISHGEGWHNNHHADQRAAAHGHKWWEFDVTWITIRLLEKLGLVKSVVLPRAWTKNVADPS
jgi:stearoyl-CoA desaturase (delta-9 desaturase)